MRKLSFQLIWLVVIIVLVSSLFALVISDQVAKLLYADMEYSDQLAFGLALKEVLLPIIVIVLSWIQMQIYSKSLTKPISDLTNATVRISSGDFETTIPETSKIREIATLQGNFNMMARELRSNEILKRDFVSNVSHEFKTPLSVIKGYADLLCDESISDDERREYAQMISKEAERLSHLTSNMLKMSKLNNQEIIVSPKEFSLDEQIRQSILLVMNKMAAKNIEIEPDLIPVTISGDEELLSQVWLNLLDNAVKYTNDGGNIWVTMAQKKAGEVSVTVADNGIGMDEKTRAKIFEQFYQADSSHGKDGNGLGLAIVSRIIKLHKGNITVKSTEGKGSEFCVTLPCSYEKKETLKRGFRYEK